METTRKYTNLAPVCEETITHDMELITKAAEKNIGAELPEDFGVILDDCTFGSEHYMAVASFVSALFRFLLPYEDDLDQVQLLMKHLRTIKQAAKLRLKTPLKPKLRQPSFSNYLEPNADIVHSPDFESGVVKVLSGQVKRFSRGSYKQASSQVAARYLGLMSVTA
ncbi:hypothetical protein PC128_g10355 [Phytophthora cactorum]|nr:hypothetical protein PC128_g10355 [Phytophthora cactorum]